MCDAERQTHNAGIDRVTDTMIDRYAVIDRYRAPVRGLCIKIDVSAIIVFKTNSPECSLVNL